MQQNLENMKKFLSQKLSLNSEFVHKFLHTGCGKSPWTKIKSEFTRSLNDCS